MSKMIKLFAVSLFSLSSMAVAQTSGSGSGSSGSSGSAGLGIDTAALTVVSGGANPAISVSGRMSLAMSGPMGGLISHFSGDSGAGGGAGDGEK